MNMPARAPLGRERVGQDRGRVGHQHRPADRLQEPPADQPQRPVGALIRVEREQDRGDREYHEARVVHLHPAEHVAELAQVDHQHRLDEAVAHDHPQQVADVARRERVEVDAAKDRRERDDDDRPVERGHEDGRGRVREGDPGIPIRLGRDRLRRRRGGA
jgi:hypothetical protein